MLHSTLFGGIGNVIYLFEITLAKKPLLDITFIKINGKFVLIKCLLNFLRFYVRMLR